MAGNSLIVRVYHFDDCGQNAFSFQHAGETPEWMWAVLLRQAMRQPPAGFPVPIVHCNASRMPAAIVQPPQQQHRVDLLLVCFRCLTRQLLVLLQCPIQLN